MSGTAAVTLGHGVVLEPQGWAPRLGRALWEARKARHASLRDLARQSGGRFTARELHQFERGLRPAGDLLSKMLADLYEIDLVTIAPPRAGLEIDLDTHLLRTGGATRSFTVENDIVQSALVAYLELVWALRGTDRTVVPLRRDDVHVLADVLELDEELVVATLAELMQCSREDAKRLLAILRRRTLLVPVTAAAVAGLVIGIAAHANRDVLAPLPGLEWGPILSPAATPAPTGPVPAHDSAAQPSATVGTLATTVPAARVGSTTVQASTSGAGGASSSAGQSGSAPDTSSTSGGGSSGGAGGGPGGWGADEPSGDGQGDDQGDDHTEGSRPPVGPTGGDEGGTGESGDASPEGTDAPASDDEEGSASEDSGTADETDADAETDGHTSGGDDTTGDDEPSGETGDPGDDGDSDADASGGDDTTGDDGPSGETGDPDGSGDDGGSGGSNGNQGKSEYAPGQGGEGWGQGVSGGGPKK
jgi:transcriptional regulator with XRE-family HTH domain